MKLKRRTDPFLVPSPKAANDNAERRREFKPAGRHVVIYKPAKSVMTSGRAGTKRWLLEFEPQSAPFIEPLMGWTGSTDPMAYMTLSFPTCEAAVAYAERQGFDYEVREPAGMAKSSRWIENRQPQPMQWWPIASLDSRSNDLLVAESGGTGFVPTLAA